MRTRSHRPPSLAGRITLAVALIAWLVPAVLGVFGGVCFDGGRIALSCCSIRHLKSGGEEGACPNCARDSRTAGRAERSACCEGPEEPAPAQDPTPEPAEDDRCVHIVPASQEDAPLANPVPEPPAPAACPPLAMYETTLVNPVAVAARPRPRAVAEPPPRRSPSAPLVLRV